MSSSHVVVLAIDGLRASALGAYGGGGRATPALDHLASRSLLCEWTYSQSPGETGIYEHLLHGESTWSHMQLVTDVPGVAQHRVAAEFDDVQLIRTPEVDHPAERIAATATASSFASFADVLLQPPEGVASQKPRLTWIHASGLTGPWDAPTELVMQLVEEDDPEPPVSVAVAAGEVDRHSESDAIFIAAIRYASQVAVLDACLEGWLELVEQSENPPAVLALVGLRGFALGEHGAIGLAEAGPYSESRHVPLLLRTTPAGQASGPIGQRWGDAPIGLSQLPSLLAQLVNAESDLENALAAAGSPTLALQAASHRCLRTSEWCFVQPIAPPDAIEPPRDQLYVKPDDRWEYNDIASLEPQVAESFAAELADVTHCK